MKAIMIIKFFSALILTILIESITAYMLGYRGKLLYLTLLLINIMTNPTINLVLLLIYQMNNYTAYITSQLLLEILVVIVEWRLLKYTYPKEKKSLLLLSIIMNSASYLFGLIIAI